MYRGIMEEMIMHHKMSLMVDIYNSIGWNEITQII